VTSSTYQLETTACIEQLRQLSTWAEVATALLQRFHDFGCENVIFTGLPTHRQKLEDLVLVNTFPAEFFRVYVEQQFVNVCPVVRHCKRSILPFELTDAPYDPEREPQAAAVMSTAEDFGIVRGLVVPVPVPDRNRPHRAASFAGRYLDLSQASKDALHLIALYGFERLRQLMGTPNEDPVALTRREREVLTWIAAGKSAWELGEILGVAERTVNEHSQMACRKLRAVNRTQAVAIALERRLIEF
jgi:LuxR family transcriptional regulator, quorum-sensing system regulator BjaR1